MDMQLLLIVGGVVVLAGLVLVWRLQKPRQDPAKRAKVRVMEGLDTLMSWQPQATRIMTVAERKAYAALCAGLPEHIILAQVPLARFLKVPTRHSYSEWLRRVGVMCADLVVCDSSSQVIAAVDIRAPESQENDKARQRHSRMDKVLEAADIPLHVWREDALPNAIGARSAILGTSPDIPIPSAVPVMANPVSVGSKPPSAQPLPTPVVIEDEGMEQRDPPSSTWFDEIDSAPAPLSPLPPRGSGPSIR
jgi:hypothetical protein